MKLNVRVKEEVVLETTTESSSSSTPKPESRPRESSTSVQSPSGSSFSSYSSYSPTPCGPIGGKPPRGNFFQQQEVPICGAAPKSMAKKQLLEALLKGTVRTS